MKICGAAAILLTGALLVGCDESSKTNATPTPVPTATSVSAPDGDPVPEHLTFAPGETIDADGRAGIFFLDPKTGAAEAWVVPGGEHPAGGFYLPFNFTIGGVSGDGGIVLYTCRESGDAGLAPCGDKTQEAWYMLDTRTGSRTRIDAFTGDFLSISPNGEKLLGRVPGGFALADASQPGDLQPVMLSGTASSDPANAHADWAPDGTRVVLTLSAETRSTLLINADAARAVELDPSYPSYRAYWSPDGARFTLGHSIDDSRSELIVLTRDGDRVWSKPIAAPSVVGIWSGDGTLLHAEEQERPPTQEFGALGRVVVLDANTGETKYRVRGAFCPIGWAGKSRTLLTSSYTSGQVVADLDAGSLGTTDEYVRPTPFDDGLAIIFDGSDFYSYELSTGARELIAKTTVSPAWDSAHEPLFAGERLVFASLHLGHGGCGEGNSPRDPPPPELLSGPFPDDAPVRRGSAR